jgi:ABC-type phosphate transport system substrate-binding protein
MSTHLLAMMFPMKTAILNLSSNLENEFTCILSVRESDGRLHTGKVGKLLKDSELFNLYNRWRLAYDHEVGVIRNATIRGSRLSQIEGETNIPNSEEAWKDLVSRLNKWLDSDDFLKVKEELLRETGREEIKFLIQTDDRNLWRLPWHAWRSLDPEKAEIAFCPEDTRFLESEPQEKKIIRTLVILGNSDNINTQQDRAIIENLDNLETVVLSQTNLDDICSHLRDEKGFDILLFSGHSFSRGNSGFISLNEESSVKIDEFRRSLSAATRKGLKLAIFNSCESLSFGQGLAQLVPRTILMKESIPDDFAQAFLKRFFEYFSTGDSFIVAVRKTRDILEPFDGRYPSVTSIPVIIQAHPEEPPLFWSDLGRGAAAASTTPTSTGTPNNPSGTQNPPPETIIQITVRILKQTALPISLIALLGGGLAIYNSGILNSSSSPNTQIPKTLLPPLKTIAEVKFLSNSFNYGGSTSFKDALTRINERLSGVTPNFVVPGDDRNKGSRAGISMLIQGHIDVALSSIPLDDTQKSNKTDPKGQTYKLEEIPVAIDAIAVVVHPDLSISSLTIEQLREIYAGDKTNWQELDGPDLPITLLSRDDVASGTVSWFEDKVMKGLKFSGSIIQVGSTTDALRKIKEKPGSIYFATASEVIQQCNVKPISISKSSSAEPVSPYVVGSSVSNPVCPNQNNQANSDAFTDNRYSLTRPLFVVIKNDKGTKQETGNSYARALLSDEGQNILSESGFGKIRK